MSNMTNTYGEAEVGAGRHAAEEIRKVRSFKATEWEWRAIQEAAEEEGMSASEYIRSSCIKTKKPNYLDLTTGEAVNIYEKAGLADMRLKNQVDLQKVHGYTAEQIPGFENLSNENQELFKAWIINFINGQSMSSRFALIPTGINFVVEITRSTSEENIGNAAFVLNPAGQQIGVIRDWNPDAEAYTEEYEERYLRFDYNLFDHQNWMHAISENGWY